MRDYRSYILVLFIMLFVGAGYFSYKGTSSGPGGGAEYQEQDVREQAKHSTGTLQEGKDLIDDAGTLNDKDKNLLHDDKNIVRSGSVVSTTHEDIQGLEDQTKIIDFTNAYKQAKKGHDAKRQLSILEQLYAKKHVERLLPFMIQLALHTRDYDKALERVTILRNKGLLTSLVDDETLFLLLFNGLELTKEDVSYIKELVLYYADQGYITVEKLPLYKSLITYTKGNFVSYEQFMNELSETEYADRYHAYQRNKKIVESFNDVPEYYFDALIATTMFRQGYRQIARVASKRLIQVDSNYILPRQLLLYSSLFLGYVDDVHKTSERLLDHDKDHEQLYTFLDAIAFFQEGQYAPAILKFKNIRDERYMDDAKRYLLLSYRAIDDDVHTYQILEDLLAEETLSPYDFYTIFDMFFYEPLRNDEEVVLFAKYFKTALAYLDLCYEQVEQHYAYICLYGKSGLLLANEQDEKAYQYLQRLTKWYPKGFIYEALGDIAYRLGKYDDAKKRFLHAVSVGSDEERGALIEKVRKLVLEE